MCDIIQEHQQVQASEFPTLSSEIGSDDCSDQDNFDSKNVGGNLNEMGEDAWNELCGACSVAVHSTPELSEKDMAAHVGEENYVDVDVVDSHISNTHVDIEDVDRRHPHDPTRVLREDDVRETCYMLENEHTKSRIGTKHARSKSVLWPCDGMKLLQVLRGVCKSTSQSIISEAHLRRESVEAAKLVHEDVYDEFQHMFDDGLQLQ